MSVELELKNGKRRKFHPNVANVLIRRGMGVEVQAGAYLTRDMRAAEPVRRADPVEIAAPVKGEAEEAPYGYKADGTPRKRPGRTKADE